MTTPSIGEIAARYFREGHDKTQRFGQFFINYYMPSDTVWPELFYEEDDTAAVEAVIQYLQDNQ
jgi:hypothetical protein